MPAAGPTGNRKGNPNALGAAEAKAAQRPNVVRDTRSATGRAVPVPSYPRIPDARPASAPSPAERKRLRNA